MIYNIVLISDVQQSDLVLHTRYLFFSRHFSYMLLQSTEQSSLFHGSLLIIYFIYSVVCMLNSNSYFTTFILHCTRYSGTIRKGK